MIRGRGYRTGARIKMKTNQETIAIIQAKESNNLGELQWRIQTSEKFGIYSSSKTKDTC